MNINEIRIEKIIILLLALFGIILFIDYTFGISNVIQIYYKNKNLSSFKRDLFLCLYTISIIPCIGFYSLCNFDKNSNKEPELMLNIIRPFITLFIGYYLYKLLIFINCLDKDFVLMCVLSLQFLYFMKLHDKFVKLYNKIVKFF